MDRKYQHLQVLFEQKKHKYPNITKVWKQYIYLQHDRLQNNMDKFIEMFSNIENRLQKDVPVDTLCFLMLMSRINQVLRRECYPLT